MATELEGRALDAACAKAMGYRVLTNDIDELWQEKGDEQEQHDGSHLRRYSTNPACIPEMLAWLHDPPAVVAIGSWWNGTWAFLTHTKFSMDKVPEHAVRGATISEALARLVVAVKEAKP